MHCNCPGALYFRKVFELKRVVTFVNERERGALCVEAKLGRDAETFFFSEQRVVIMSFQFLKSTPVLSVIFGYASACGYATVGKAFFFIEVIMDTGDGYYGFSMEIHRPVAV